MNHIVRPYFNTPLDTRRTQGMIAYYDATTQQGGGYLVDKVGNKHGVFYNSPTWQDGNKICGNGTSQYIIPSGLNLVNESRITISTLVSVDAWTSGANLLSFRAFSAGYSYALASDRINVGRSGYLVAANSSGLSANKVFRLTVVHNSSSSINVYVNGLDLTMTGNDYWNTNSNFIIGARYNSSVYSRFSSFKLQQLAIFNRALTHGEILAHYEDPYYFYERPKIYGFIFSSSGNSLPAIINNHRQQGVM